MTNFPINHHHFGGCTPFWLRACVGEYQYSRRSGRIALGALNSSRTVQSQVNKKKTRRVKQEKALLSV